MEQVAVLRSQLSVLGQFQVGAEDIFRVEFTLAVPITILYNHRLSTCNNNICLLPMGTSNRFRITVLLTVWL